MSKDFKDVWMSYVDGYLGNEHSKGGKSKCKGLEVGRCLTCAGVSNKTVAEVE